METDDQPIATTGPRSRYTYLLLGMIGYTLIQVATPPLFVVDLLFIVILLATIRAMKGHRLTIILAIVLMVTFWVSSGVRMTVGAYPLMHVLDDLLVTAFMGLVALVILRDVLGSQKTTTDSIFGAICSYILIGVGWAALYGAVSTLIPGSISFSGGQPALRDTQGALVYFSFVTMTTLGYGDIVPVHRLARTLCWMEAMFGQLYLAVLVAKLVAGHVSQPRQ